MHANPTDAAARWLLHSGIQNPPGAKNANGADIGGAFNAWFDPETNSYSYVYSEITGYALTALMYLYGEKGEDLYRTHARQAADWLISTQTKEGAFPTALRYAENDFKSPHFHTFDVGMVLNGLLCLYDSTKEERYLESARKAADWLIRFQNPDGSLAAHVTAEGEVTDTPTTWSTQPGSYHAKIAIGLLHFFRASGDERYRTAAVNLCEYALTRQQPDGQFYTYGEEQGTNFHPHFYSAEGLWVVGTIIQEKRYLDAAHRATMWAHTHTKDGIVPRHKHAEFNYNERVDVLAQGYRMFALHGLADSTEAKTLRGVLLSRQYNKDNQSQHGGFTFGVTSDGHQLPHINCWVTMFALQALLLGESGMLPEPLFLI